MNSELSLALPSIRRPVRGLLEYKRMPGQFELPLNIDHRGHANRLENTINSFHESIDMGAQMMELDVRLSSDGVPVVFHDATLKRMAKLSGAVRKRTARFLTGIDLGGGSAIPTLDETLGQLLPRIPVNIEMKFDDLNYRPLVGAVLNSVRKAKAERRVLVSSFYHQALDILNRSAPEVTTAPLFGDETGNPHSDDLKRLSKLSPWNNDLPFSRPAAVVKHKMIDSQLCQQFHDSKLSLLTFTVDDSDEMIRLIDLGVEGIMTNRPDILQDILNSKKRA